MKYRRGVKRAGMASLQRVGVGGEWGGVGGGRAMGNEPYLNTKMQICRQGGRESKS
jgi:hypothetical protein